MFLPSQLPEGVRRKSETEIQQKMGGKKGKKAKANDQQDEMLNPSSPMASTSAAHPTHPPGFVARSWARISGRRRRQRKQMAAMMGRRQERLATTLTTVDHPTSSMGNGGGWPTITMDGSGNIAGGNLARLAHLEGDEEEGRKRHFIGRGMDRLRRSIRRTLHKGSQSGQVLTNSSTDGHPSSSAGQSHRLSKNYCHSDEIAVRSAACSFPVKYLGACEVFESRGMSVCESALQHLRTRKRTVKALLYVSGDGIRVVDQENNRGLIVDQTIEKVSFCSPDRQNDKGFAYICRDGATRRWMCHGFHASKDSGERLSHAVGCAFTVCLEKKKKRDAETAAYKSAQALANSLNKPAEILGGNFQNELPQFASEGGIANEEFARTNQAYRSFRQLSISERRADPQKAILVEHIHRSQSSLDSPNITSTVGANVPAATPRPTANPALFERTGSLRAPNLSSSTSFNSGQKSTMPNFNRFNSLQHGNFELKSTRMSLHNEPIWEGEDWMEEGGNNGNAGGNQQPAFYNWPTDGSNRFYRTLPHSMPNFGKAGINNVVIPPPPILEEDKQQTMQSTEMDNSHNSSPPADPFISNDGNIEPPPHFRADNWLEQTFQRAASSTATLPRSATMNWPQPQPPSQQQQNWAQFPQSQSSFQMASDWPNGISNKSNNCPPAQPPPPLPSWINSGPSNSAQSLTPNAPMPILATTLRMPMANEQKGQDETDQSNSMAKNHSRKSSGNRRIGYQLLQETDVSLSPPKSESILERVIGKNEENATAIDPFDVNWSQRVLKETAKQRQNGNGKNENGEKGKEQQDKEAEKNNPFGWDLSSPPVNV